MHRFFVLPEWLELEPIPLTGDIAHQLTRVLRVRPGEQIELLDNLGQAFLVRLDHVSSARCLATMLSAYRPDTEPRIPMVLYQGLPRGHRMDYVLQKATELGVTRVVPMVATRSTPTGHEGEGGGRLQRWGRILQEAAEQSGRARIPEITEPTTLADSLKDVRAGDVALGGALAASTMTVRAALDQIAEPPSCVRIWVGPEGGFDPAETELLREAGVALVSMGPRVLRTETAGPVMLALVAYALGEMDRVLPNGSE